PTRICDLFLFHYSLFHRTLSSFPTRRSSDLNVHANLFKGTIEDGKAPDADHPGHPVTVFKEENMALRSALLRINNILDTFEEMPDRKSTRLNSSHVSISYAVFCLKKNK